ncbi:MAG: hypothetical protein IMF08_15375, partial [Proteobacteria bacterium]|nr:hypothetical protein [Pseudomonadota bacterium]
FQETRKSRPMTLDEFANLKKKLRPLLASRPLMPATQFGPLRGTGSGKFDDFAWLSYFTVLVREPVFMELRRAGFDLLGVPADIEFRRKQPEPLMELELWPSAHLHPSDCPKQCDICGRHLFPFRPGFGGLADSGKRPRPRLDAARFDATIPLQRIFEWPTILVASESFAGFIEKQGYTGFTLTPLELL